MMNGPDDSQQFQLKLQEIRASRSSRSAKDGNGIRKTVNSKHKQVEHILQPIIQSFVDSDQGLKVQSQGPMGFFIAYGLRHVCRIQPNVMDDESVELGFQSDSDTMVCVYTGPLNEEEIRKATESALLNWYQEVV